MGPTTSAPFFRDAGIVPMICSISTPETIRIEQARGPRRFAPSYPSLRPQFNDNGFCYGS